MRWSGLYVLMWHTALLCLLYRVFGRPRMVALPRNRWIQKDMLIFQVTLIISYRPQQAANPRLSVRCWPFCPPDPLWVWLPVLRAQENGVGEAKTFNSVFVQHLSRGSVSTPITQPSDLALAPLLPVSTRLVRECFALSMWIIKSLNNCWSQWIWD